jgi:hypothetical protein
MGRVRFAVPGANPAFRMSNQRGITVLVGTSEWSQRQSIRGGSPVLGIPGPRARRWGGGG